MPIIGRKTIIQPFVVIHPYLPAPVLRRPCNAGDFSFSGKTKSALLVRIESGAPNRHPCSSNAFINYITQHFIKQYACLILRFYLCALLSG